MISIKNVSKSFPGVKALDNVSVDLYEGEVHAIVGENGAGKTTLMSIIRGILKADSGNIYLDNKKIDINHPDKDYSKEINMVTQEINLIPSLSVAENIFIGHFPKFKNSLFVSWKELYEKSKKILKKMDLDVNPNKKISSLSVDQQQMVQIAKAISTDSKFLIMDEPTASLSHDETKILFKIIREFKLKNRYIIYISHRLEEIFEIADKVTILRDGKRVDTFDIKDATKEKLIFTMVGRHIEKKFKKRKRINGNTIFSCKDLSKDGVFQNISLSLKSGEILGIYGLMGAGRTEIAQSIYGVNPTKLGKIYVNREEKIIKSPSIAINNGITYLPEDRKEQSIIPLMSVKENITISSLKKYSNFIFTSFAKEKEITEKFVNRLRIKVTSINQKSMDLSGGNQQKLTFSRLLALKPKVLILDEPTRGIDVGAKVEIYKIIEELAENGIGIIMISSELPEVLLMSDRILVIKLGKISSSFINSENLTQEEVLKAASPS